MRRARLMQTAFAAAALTTLAAAVPALAQPSPQPPIIRAGGVEKVSDHAHVILDQGVGFVPNVGFVVGDDAVLVIDTGLGQRNGEIVLAETQALAPGRDIYIVSTHFHPEHDLGAQAFPDEAQVIRSEDQIDEIEESGVANIERFSTFTEANAELLEGAYHREADIVFTDEHQLDLGGVSVRILAMGPNHTRGDTAIFVEGDRVLFSGDVTMSNAPAFLTDTTMAQWFSSLDRFDALEPAVVIGAHGTAGDASMIGAYRTYLTEVRDRTAAHKAAGKTIDETVDEVTAEMPAIFPNAGGRIGGAVRVAYNEAP